MTIKADWDPNIIGLSFAVSLWVLHRIWKKFFPPQLEPLREEPDDPAFEALVRMTLEEARAEADRALADADRWRCSPPEPVVRQVSFGPGLEEFFRRFSRADSRQNEASIEDGEQVASCIDSRYLVIGALSEHSEIAAKEGSDEVFVFYTDDPVDPTPIAFPSIYHLICGVERGDVA